MASKGTPSDGAHGRRYGWRVLREAGREDAVVSELDSLLFMGLLLYTKHVHCKAESSMGREARAGNRWQSDDPGWLVD